nr:serine/threonine-protein kinase ATR [Ipomoea trifida]
MVNDCDVRFSTSSSSVYENPRVGEKRPQDSMETYKEKLQKFEGEFVGFGMKCEDLNKLMYESTFMLIRGKWPSLPTSLSYFPMQHLKDLVKRVCWLHLGQN